MLPIALVTTLASLVLLVLGHGDHHDGGIVQFCKDRDFCFAQTAFSNPATNNHDFYITFEVNGLAAGSTGWTALGLGSKMEGALMFVVYGDPAVHEKPTLSVRTTMEQHHPPLPFTPDYANGAEFQVVFAKWVEVGNSYTAKLNLICYNCTRWPGTTIDPNSTEQPWIWAQNPNQDLQSGSLDALLQMHSKSSDGFGFFFVDMIQSLTSSAAPEFPIVDSTRGPIGAATDASGVESASGESISGFRYRAWQVHGFLLTIAFLLLYPIGVVLLRGQSSNSFKLHWIIQVLASGVTVLGIMLGIYLHPEIEHWHQVMGILVGIAPFFQSALGWRHHVIFRDTSRRTMFSSAHINFGRVILALGALNILLGMGLNQWSAFFILALAAVILVEGFALFVFLRKKTKHSNEQRYAQLSDDEHEEAFALSDVESPVDADEEEGSEKDFRNGKDQSWGSNTQK